MIPLVDLKAQYLRLARDIDAAVRSVIESTDFIKGAAVERFEREFASYCGVTHAVGVANGTDGLRLALEALDIGPGDVVYTVPNTFIATTEAIGQVGATIRFVDADPDSWMLDPSALAAVAGDGGRAVIPVDLFGHMVDYDALADVATRHDLTIIEDAAQAHGAKYRGHTAGAFGIAASFSFYPGKNLGAYGDAGAVVTNDGALAERVRMLSDHGRLAKYEHAVEGWNSRLDTIQAAILSVKLADLPGATLRRQQHAERYRANLADVDGIRWPEIVSGSEPVHHLMVISVTDRDALRAHLGEHGIATGVHYPIALHLQPAYRGLGYGRGDFPVAEELADTILSLPMFPELTDAQIDRICGVINDYPGLH
jgi:dTDP-4-amino-4,6-dideoxygalactose transaminase